MTIKAPNLSTLIAIIGGLGGPLGVILGALHAGSLSTPTNNLVLAISGLLTAITHFHAASVVATKAKATTAPAKAPVV
jgi:hypothetical protein